MRPPLLVPQCRYAILTAQIVSRDLPGPVFPASASNQISPSRWCPRLEPMLVRNRTGKHGSRMDLPKKGGTVRQCRDRLPNPPDTQSLSLVSSPAEYPELSTTSLLVAVWASAVSSYGENHSALTSRDPPLRRWYVVAVYPVGASVSVREAVSMYVALL